MFVCVAFCAAMCGCGRECVCVCVCVRACVRVVRAPCVPCVLLRVLRGTSHVALQTAVHVEFASFARGAGMAEMARAVLPLAQSIGARGRSARRWGVMGDAAALRVRYVWCAQG
jgi:hypothetical protein